MDTKCRELGNLYLEKQKTPLFVLEALSLRQKRKLLMIKEYDQEIMKEFPDWRDATTEEMSRVVDGILGSDEAWTKEIKIQAGVLENCKLLIQWEEYFHDGLSGGYHGDVNHHIAMVVVDDRSIRAKLSKLIEDRSELYHDTPKIKTKNGGYFSGVMSDIIMGH
jgi:hypothetical protein